MINKNKYLHLTSIIFSIFILIIGCNKKVQCKKIFYSNGILKQEICEIEADSLSYKRVFFEDGNIYWEVPIDKNGKQQGIYKEYFKSGKLRSESNYIDDSLDGILKYFYKNGNLEQVVVFKKGKRNGYCKFYYPNGALKTDAICKNDTTLYYKDYDSLGNLVAKFPKENTNSIAEDLLGNKYLDLLQKPFYFTSKCWMSS